MDAHDAFALYQHKSAKAPAAQPRRIFQGNAGKVEKDAPFTPPATDTKAALEERPRATCGPSSLIEEILVEWLRQGLLRGDTRQGRGSDGGRRRIAPSGGMTFRVFRPMPPASN
jgi:hypothetical protein